MKITDNLHLCYSLNVYPGTTWAEKMAILRDKIPLIQKSIQRDQSEPFGIGLWLDAQTVDELQTSGLIDNFKLFLNEHNYYVFTVNAFPYKTFHGESVKTDVYAPDWTQQERVQYTNKVADILANLIPPGITGSISTVPGSYNKWITSNQQCELIARNILTTAQHLKNIHIKTGKKLVLSIEMEPDCLWESPQQFIAFYDKYFRSELDLCPYIGVCYDTCHQELLKNQPGEGLTQLIEAGITISKIQLSAALGAQSTESKIALANTFCDTVYLHQTRVFAEESLYSYNDLPEALNVADTTAPWIVHYHIPIYLTSLFAGLTAEKSELLEVIRMLQESDICSNIEIETYTYATLPAEMRIQSLEVSIAREYQWVINTLALCTS